MAGPVYSQQPARHIHRSSSSTIASEQNAVFNDLPIREDDPFNSVNESNYSMHNFNNNSSRSTNYNARGTRINHSINSGSYNFHITSSASGQFNQAADQLTRKQKFKIWYRNLVKLIKHSINIIQAVMLRILFSLHSLIAIFYVFLVKQDEWYLLNVIGVILLGLELFITIIKRKGREPRYFFPSFFIYICTMIPPIWFVELTRIDQANAKRRTSNSSYEVTFDILESLSGDTLAGIEVDGLLSNARNIQLENIAVGLEISLLILVILGRWFSPKGHISRSTLSQLLLVYMSLASDIVDLLSLLNETQVQESVVMHYFTLAIFSWSLFQFCLNLVVSRGRSFQSVALMEPDQNDQFDLNGSLSGEDQPTKFSEQLNKLSQSESGVLSLGRNSKKKRKQQQNCVWRFFRFDLLDAEIWSILITLIFQDGPFFALRLTAVLRFDVRTFVTIFFTCKNAIILFLQFYRLSAIIVEARKHGKKDELTNNKADAITSLNKVAAELDKFVLLSYAQNILIKNQASKRKVTKSSSKNSLGTNDMDPRQLFQNAPVLLKSNLSNYHKYAIVLTSSFNINTKCCDCGCHIQD